MKKIIFGIGAFLVGAVSCGIYVHKKETKKTKYMKEYSEKHLELYLMMNQWVKAKQENKNVADFLKKKNYKKIAIYGMNYVGETLVQELCNEGVEIAYGIDKNACNIDSNIEVVLPTDCLKDVDAVIVTPIYYFDSIEEELHLKIDCPIVSLDDVLYEL